MNRKLLVAGALAVVLCGGMACTRKMANFRRMQIDPATLRVRMDGEFLSLTPPNSDYYFRFIISSDRYTVDHYGPGAKVNYNEFMVDSDSVSTRTKYQVLLSGAYGTVYGKSTYFYGPQYKNDPGTEFLTVLYMNEIGCEPFQLVPALPPEQKLTLSAISVVRVLKALPEFLVVSANYAPDGHLESLHVNGAKGGNWVHSNEVAVLYPKLGVATMIGDRPATRQYFGLPAEFPVQTPHDPGKIFGHSEVASTLDVVNLHYDRNRWVSQDLFTVDNSRSTRFLTYNVTEEDRVLEPIDQMRAFGQFHDRSGSQVN